MSRYIGPCSSCGDPEAVIDTTGDDNNTRCVECVCHLERQLNRRAAERLHRQAEFDSLIRDIALRAP